MPTERTPPSLLARVLVYLHRTEDGILALLLTTMILVAVSQIVLRNVFDSGFAWSDPFLRTLVLWVGLLGALAATRDDKHIVIDALLRVLPEAWKPVIRALTSLFTAAVTGIIAWHSARFVVLDYEAGITVFANVPSWLAESVIPLSFALMTLRFVLLAGRHLLLWRHRGTAE